LRLSEHGSIPEERVKLHKFARHYGVVTFPGGLCLKIEQWALIERPYSSAAQPVGAVCDRPPLLRQSLPGENYDGGVDDVGCTRSTAELPARAREVFVKRHNFDFCSPQKPGECDPCGAIAPSLPYNARRYPEISTLSQSPIEQSDHSPVTAIQRDQPPVSSVTPGVETAARVLPISSPAGLARHIQ
jgi:hypothetical protein